MRPHPQLGDQRGGVDAIGAPHRQILETLTLTWPDEAGCAASAAALARAAGIGDALVELAGELGSGKTTFVRHLLRALGVTGRVKSPTYALVETYDVGGVAVSHFDFYRFADPREWVDAGLRDLVAAPGLRLVEWPDRAAGLLPAGDLRLELVAGDGDRRVVTVHAHTPRGRALLAALRR